MPFHLSGHGDTNKERRETRLREGNQATDAMGALKAVAIACSSCTQGLCRNWHERGGTNGAAQNSYRDWDTDFLASI